MGCLPELQRRPPDSVELSVFDGIVVDQPLGMAKVYARSTFQRLHEQNQSDRLRVRACARSSWQARALGTSVQTQNTVHVVELARMGSGAECQLGATHRHCR